MTLVDALHDNKMGTLSQHKYPCLQHACRVLLLACPMWARRCPQPGFMTMRAVQVLVEGPARGDPSQMTGKTCTMKRVFFNAQHLPGPGRHPKAGDYLAVEVHGASATALLATSRHLTSVQGFVALYGSTVPPRQQQKLGGEACWQQRQVAHG